MKITKIGHACLLIEENGVRFLTDPGSYSPVPDNDGIDAVLITHEHQDHVDIANLQAVVSRNPEVQIITVSSVEQKLKEAGIPSRVIGDGEIFEVRGVTVQSQGAKHALIYGDLPNCQNTGFMIAGRVFHPGDSFHIPDGPVEILLLPVGGPWMKLAECIDYAKAVMSKVVIPIHDGFFRPDRAASTRMFPKMILEPLGIEFRDMTEGSIEEF